MCDKNIEYGTLLTSSICMLPSTDLHGLFLSGAPVSDIDPVHSTLRRLGALVGYSVFDVLAGLTREGGGQASGGEEPRCVGEEVERMWQYCTLVSLDEASAPFLHNYVHSTKDMTQHAGI